MVHAGCGAASELGEHARALDPSGSESVRLAYLALGDYHRQQKVPGLGMPAWYPGTPEPDRAPTAGQEAGFVGEALVVDVSAAGAQVRPVAVDGGYTWVVHRAMLHDGSGLDQLDADLRAMVAGRVQRVLGRLDLDGSRLGLVEHRRWETMRTQLEPLFESLTMAGTMTTAPTAEELAALGARPGLVGAAAGALAQLQGESPGRIAAALDHLHRLAGA